jgi:hypothetical protein
MKKWLKSLLLISVFLLAKYSKAQVNLIKDGSFEDTLTNWQWQVIPISGGLNNWEFFLGVYNPWGLGFSVPMSTVAQNTAYLIPNGSFNITPRSGNMALEIVTHLDLDKYYLPTIGWNISNMRTPVRTKLKSKLVAGKQYCSTIWVASQVRQTYYNTNGLGMYFDNGQLDTVITVLHDTSGIWGRYVQAQVISYQVIIDSVNWTKIQGSFIANGTETYVTIGNWLTDSTQTKVVNGPASWQVGDMFFSDYLIDDASVIPIDITTWLHDTTCAIGDSVWVGLDRFDYAEGKWYNTNMNYIKTGQGFWYKPTQAVTSFIQSIDVCGTLKYDTMTVYAYPFSNVQLAMNPNRVQLKVWPNPATNSINVTCLSFLNNQEKLQILDVTGKEIKHLIPNNKQMEIDISGLANGLYVVKYGSKSVKFVKE